MISMPRAWLLLVLLLFVAATDRGGATDAWRDKLWSPVACPAAVDCARSCCPDCYCAKPAPCPPPAAARRCDDYCGKPAPCPPPRACSTCDRYCKKPLPELLCPPCLAPRYCPPGCPRPAATCLPPDVGPAP